MTKDEALTLALEALEACIDYIAPYTHHIQGEEDADTAEEAITAIKEALAQPEQKLKQVAHVYLLDAKGWPKVGWDDGRGIKVGDKLYTLTSAEKLLAELISEPENTSIPWPDEERNFCPRCGKRTADLTTIHTCTPPIAADPKAFHGFPSGSVSTPKAGGKCLTAGETAPVKEIDPNQWAFDRGLEST